MESELTPDQVAEVTYRWDRLRGAGHGIIESCWQVFALLIAIRVFQADESIKQFIPAGLGIGFLISPIGLSLFNRMRLQVSTIVSRLWICVALALAGMTLSRSIISFVACIALAQVIASQAVPLMTHLYSTNYSPKERGSRLSTTFVIASLSGIGFGLAGGKLLDYNVSLYPLVFVSGACAALLAAWASRRIPSDLAHTLQSRDPIRSLAIAWDDKLFRMMLVGWMLMGLGSLMMIPIRVEYLANPLYGINASNAQISALLISTVHGFRLLSTKFWGALFDKVNVVTLRMMINLVFTLSIVLFFFTSNLWIIGIGCALLGTGFGGGGILWALYVTKLAPPDKVAAYMSVHGSTTGLRMALAPFIGYTVVQFTHPAFAAWIALAMIAISTLIFLPLRPLIDAKAGELEELPAPRINPV
ncbi:MAG TPA: MFS transporter [Oceanipulchritudo sp.]|nr:MFS transporter [Oceanipulchritudo sp.]